VDAIVLPLVTVTTNIFDPTSIIPDSQPDSLLLYTHFFPVTPPLPGFS